MVENLDCPFKMCYWPVNQEESDTYGEQRDAGQHAEEQEQEDPLGRLHLEEEHEVRVEGWLAAGQIITVVLLVVWAGGRHRARRQRTVTRAEEVSVLLHK